MAWQSIYHHRRLNKLSPDYLDCPADCDAPKAQRDQGCPDCEVTKLFEYFRKECRRLLEEDEQQRARDLELKGHVKSEWQFPDLYNDLVRTSATEAMAGEDGVLPYWTIRMYQCVMILRSERSKARRVDDYARDQALDAARKGEGTGKGRADEYA